MDRLTANNFFLVRRLIGNYSAHSGFATGTRGGGYYKQWGGFIR